MKAGISDLAILLHRWWDTIQRMFVELLNISHCPPLPVMAISLTKWLLVLFHCLPLVLHVLLLLFILIWSNSLSNSIIMNSTVSWSSKITLALVLSALCDLSHKWLLLSMSGYPGQKIRVDLPSKLYVLIMGENLEHLHSEHFLLTKELNTKFL